MSDTSEAKPTASATGPDNAAALRLRLQFLGGVLLAAGVVAFLVYRNAENRSQAIASLRHQLEAAVQSAERTKTPCDGMRLLTEALATAGATAESLNKPMGELFPEGNQQEARFQTACCEWSKGLFLRGLRELAQQPKERLTRANGLTATIQESVARANRNQVGDSCGLDKTLESAQQAAGVESDVEAKRDDWHAYKRALAIVEADRDLGALLFSDARLKELAGICVQVGLPAANTMFTQKETDKAHAAYAELLECSLAADAGTALPAGQVRAIQGKMAGIERRWEAKRKRDERADARERSRQEEAVVKYVGGCFRRCKDAEAGDDEWCANYCLSLGEVQ